MEERIKRKSTRLKHFDYGTTGAYFVTICTHNRQKILSEVVTATPCLADLNSVGEGLAPPANKQFNLSSPCVELHAFSTVGEGLAPPTIRLTKIGEIVEEQLLALEARYPCVEITDYVIMPDHIHTIIFLKRTAGGASPSPTSHHNQCNETIDVEMVKDSLLIGTNSPTTLSNIVCSFKSLTSRSCNQQFRIEKLFQRSYYDHVIRDRRDYEARIKYIYENPVKWYYDKIYEDE